jgi:hypothetical protein
LSATPQDWAWRFQQRYDAFMADLNQIAARIVRETVDDKAKKAVPKPQEPRGSDKPESRPDATSEGTGAH